jgi:tetratricopeptide (TPR) repeat protein
MTEPDRLQAAITAAKNGRRRQARALLLQLVEQEPDNEVAWLWLSELVETVDDRIIALENAQTINPNRVQTQKRLRQLRGRAGSATPERLAQAQRLIADGRFADGRDLLRQLVADEPDNELAWWELSKLVPTVEEQLIALETLLRLNPTHREATIRLTQLQHVHDDYLALGRAYEERGDLDRAITAYEFAAKQSSSAADRAIAERRLRAAQAQRRLAPVRVTEATATLVRLTAGPPVLYALLLFIHSGLNPFMLPLPFCLGGFFVLLGSFLLIATINTPYHTWWAKILGHPDRDDVVTRVLVGMLGFLLMLVPFIHLSLNAVDRLAAYRATLTP